MNEADFKIAKIILLGISVCFIIVIVVASLVIRVLAPLPPTSKPRQTSTPWVSSEDKFIERHPKQPPAGWIKYNVDDYATISIPKEWFFFPSTQTQNKQSNTYIVSNLRSLKYYDDWNPGEKFRIDISTHQISTFGKIVQNTIDDLYRQNLYEYPGTIAPYTLQTFLLNGNRVVRFHIGGEDDRFSQIVELKDRRILEINISLLIKASNEEAVSYITQFQTVLDSLNIY